MNVTPTYSEMAKRNLPLQFQIPDQYVQIMKAKRREFSNGNSVQRETERGSLIRDNGNGSNKIKEIYGSGTQYQRISRLVRAVRSTLPLQAIGGFSIFGRDCFELLMEEPFEQFAPIVLDSVKYKLTDQVEAMEFRTATGAQVRG